MLSKGDKISNYTLEKYLGKGSYGEVWLAKKTIELSDDGILVALKFLGYQPQKGKGKEDFIKQVKREVGTWIKASGHKNIVSVQDGFAFLDDTFVIVSDFAEGGSLGDWLEDNNGKSPSLEKTVEIMSEILDGLTFLHSQSPDKIIHRDLKPDNILFKSGMPCITDFGVSRMSQTITKSMAQVAATSAGTPLYMSPESFNNQPASRSMDIWSAGVILYQMLSGSFPYYSESIYALGYDVISKQPNSLPADVPREFQAVVAKALEKDVSKRFKTAEGMKASLKEALKAGEKATSQPNVNDTIIDEDFDKTKQLVIEPIKDWREIEAKKAEKLADEQRQREEAERKRQAELEQKQREAEIWRQEDAERLRAEEAKPIIEDNERETELRSAQTEIKTAIRRQINEASGQVDKEITHQKKGDYQSPLNRQIVPQKSANKPKTIWIGAIALIASLIGLIGVISWYNNRNSSSKTINPVPSPSSLASNPTNPVPSISVSETTNPTSISSSPNTFKNSIGMEFVKIPAGSFMMGGNEEDDEKPVHRVTISKDFWLQKTEVTQGQWKAVMGSNPSYFKNCGDNCPVENVSWDDVQVFIKKLNAKNEGIYRLPTEAKWEYTMRAGTMGDYAENLDAIAWYRENSDGKTHPVGMKQANTWGLYDMHGNVVEWCEDWYGSYPNEPVTDPTGATSGSERVIRGGGFGDYAGNHSSANRLSHIPSFRVHFIGFRLLRQ